MVSIHCVDYLVLITYNIWVELFMYVDVPQQELAVPIFVENNDAPSTALVRDHVDAICALLRDGLSQKMSGLVAS